jgi:hypothetical protein
MKLTGIQQVPPIAFGACFQDHMVYLTKAMEGLILANDALAEDDNLTLTAFDAWIHSQLIHMETVDDAAGFNML